MPELASVQVNGQACVVTLQREKKLNAISAEMERLLCEVVERDEVLSSRAVIFTGGTRVFSAGADLDEMRGLDPVSIMASYRGTGDWVRPQTITPAPLAASSRAAARPIPVPPPVTRATRPALASGRKTDVMGAAQDTVDFHRGREYKPDFKLWFGLTV
jgi:hypothetical protein